MMTMPRRLKRPDFEGESRSIWIDPNHLTDGEITQLSKYLPVKMAASKRAAFMVDVALAVQQSKWLRKTEAEGERREKLDRVADKSRELLKALADIRPDSWGEICAFSGEFAFEKITPTSICETTRKAILSREFWPHIWDTSQDVENIFSYAASKHKPDKQNRPRVNNAKVFVSEVIRAHIKAIGTWPPYSKGTWFPLFIAELGQIAKLGDIGRDTVESAIRGLKNPT